jgi:photosystem II stability/assembly factor-like uncharacterized protein
MRNIMILVFVLSIQNYWAISKEYINPDGGEWITIDSVLAYNAEGSNSPSYYFNLSCYDSLNCIGHYGDFMTASIYSRIRKTTDGGNSWFDIREDTSPPTYPNKRFIFYPEKDLIVIGCDSGYVLRSTDGGKNWDFTQYITTLEPQYFQLNRMYMKGKIGIMHYSGIGNAYITEDGGENWTKMQFNTNPSIRPSIFSIMDSNNIIVNSIIRTESDTSYYYFKSTNRGKNWSFVTKIPESENYYSFMNFVNEKIGFSRHHELLVQGDIFKGTSDTTSTKFYKTTDGGLTWNKIYEIIDQGRGFGNLTVADSLNFIAVNTSGAHLRTTDGGITWQKGSFFTFEGEYQAGSTSFTNTYMSPTTPIMGYGPRILKYVGKNTSVDNNKSIKQEISIYPNPSSDFITIQLSNKGLQPFADGDKVQIYDVLGIEVMSVGIGLGLSQQRIDVSHLPAGVYFVKVGGMVDRFVKM